MKANEGAILVKESLFAGYHFGVYLVSSWASELYNIWSNLE
jgi:hypothetical protein